MRCSRIELTENKDGPVEAPVEHLFGSVGQSLFAIKETHDRVEMMINQSGFSSKVWYRNPRGLFLDFLSGKGVDDCLLGVTSLWQDFSRGALEPFMFARKSDRSVQRHKIAPVKFPIVESSRLPCGLER